MVAPSFFYPIISRVAGIVLLVAGGLKAQEFLGPSVLAPHWTVLGQTALELLLGAWLLVGHYPRWARIITLICFFVFLNVSLSGALQGQPSCGCFGKVSVRPWSATGLDALMVIGLLFSPATQAGESTLRARRFRWFTFVILAFLALLVVGWPVVRTIDLAQKHIPTILSEDMPAGIDASALERANQAMERNHAALHMLVYTTETEMTQYPVKRTVIRSVRKGNETIRVTETVIDPKTEKHRQYATKTWVRGDEVRQDGLTASEYGPGGEILQISKGKRIQYAPEIHQAWISTAEFADEGLGNSIDLRCAGFQPPLRSVADWLRNRCEVLNAGLVRDGTEREVFRIRARVRSHGKHEFEVTADCIPAHSYMPRRVVYQFLPDGGVFTVTDIEYQEVGSKGAWFPSKIRYRGFPYNTTSDPDAPTGQNLVLESTVRVLAFDHDVEDEDFDPIIPAKTILMGDLPTERLSGDAPSRASQLTRTEPRTLTANQSPRSEGIGLRTGYWPFVVGMDVILLGFCLMFRRRLAFY